MTVKLNLKKNIANGVKEIVNSSNDEVLELVIDDITPLKWTLSQVTIRWIDLDSEEQKVYQTAYNTQIENGLLPEQVTFDMYVVNINNGEYKVYITNHDKYVLLFPVT